MNHTSYPTNTFELLRLGIRGMSHFGTNAQYLPRETVKTSYFLEAPLVHDLAIALVFLSMVIAPALVAMRADAGE